MLHSSMAKNRRPGRTGYSPRSLVFGLEERLIASGLSHYLEQPDDASIEHHSRDPVARMSQRIRCEAMKAVIELDHSDKWAQAIKFPSRKAEVTLFLPGHQVIFWKQATKGTKLGGRRRRTPARWAYGVYAMRTQHARTHTAHTDCPAPRPCANKATF